MTRRTSPKCICACRLPTGALSAGTGAGHQRRFETSTLQLRRHRWVLFPSLFSYSAPMDGIEAGLGCIRLL